MKTSLLSPLLALVGALGQVAALDGPVVITGATGRTGALTYLLLKSRGVDVRGYVRNATKAKELLGCNKCDESEGIFVGDTTEPESLKAPMQGAGSLIIATSAWPVCHPFPNCSYPKGDEPINVDWIGAKSQLAAFATATHGEGMVVLISTMGTTTPDDKGPDSLGDISFYKLNFEAELMASGLPYTIVKPCGLSEEPPLLKTLLVGHDDELTPKPPVMGRADVARVCAAAVQMPDAAAGLRFDICAQAGPPTPEADLRQLLESARPPWKRSGAVRGPALEKKKEESIVV